MGKLLTLLCTVGVLSAFYFYTPVPDDLKDPWMFRLGHCFIRMLHSVLFYDAKYSDGTLAQSILGYLPVPLDGDHDSLLITNTDFDGVPVTLFQPKIHIKGDKLIPAIIYFHGGGFVLGNPDAMFEITHRMAKKLQVVVASVDYRLAPVHKFPAAFEDSLKATKWFIVNAKKYNVDPQKIAVSGDSAGGLLSAAISQFIKDDKTVPDLLFQALVYPSTQQIDVNLPSAQQYQAIFGNKGVLCRRDVAMFIGLYAFGKFREDYYNAFISNNMTSRKFRETSHLWKYVNHDVILNSDVKSKYYIKPRPEDVDNPVLWNEIQDILLDVRMSPLLRDDMSGLPPAWIATCQYDPLRDDGILYANRLKEAGVHVQLKNYEGGVHGVWVSGMNLTVYQEMMTDFLAFAKNYLN